jgi:hypothetical protein
MSRYSPEAGGLLIICKPIGIGIGTVEAVTCNVKDAYLLHTYSCTRPCEPTGELGNNAFLYLGEVRRGGEEKRNSDLFDREA